MFSNFQISIINMYNEVISDSISEPPINTNQRVLVIYAFLKPNKNV